MSSHDDPRYVWSRLELLDKQKAQAALGGISRPTLDRLRRSGELGAVRVGRRVFFLADDVAAYIERHREATP
jgi:excisionase family DNA binding protein